MNNKNIFNNSILTILSVLFFSVSVFAEMGVPVQLRLKSPTGTYPTQSGLSFKLLILSPSSNCVLREEDFSGQTITNGNISLQLGSGVRGVLDPSLTLAQVYDNSKSRTGLSCVDANNNLVSSGQTYNPASDDSRVIRISTNVAGDPIIVNFNMRATPYAVQAESVGGKMAADIIVNDTTTELNQTNLNNLLLDVTHFNNLKNFASTGIVSSATNFTGALTGDVSGNQGSTSVDKIKGVAVSATAPLAGQVLVYNGAAYVPTTPPTAPVTSVAGKTGVVTLVSSDISGLGGAAVLNVGTSAGTVAAGDDSRIASAFADTSAATSTNVVSTIVKRDASGNIVVGNISASNNSTNNLYLYDGANSVRLRAPIGLGASYILTLPTDDGANGQILQTDGSGNLTWANAGGGGSVNSVSANGPLSSTGGADPVISITQANATTAGYLSSGDWSSFNSKQAALGFTPLNPANNLSELPNLVVARTNLGLGGAAVLSVGTVAGTVAAGDDARITGALQSSAYNADVADAALCTTSQTAYWNTISDKWECQNISFPAAVTSVSASAPLASSGGATPNITITQANATTAGYLSSSDWSNFNSKQAALGFTPLNPSNNLSDVGNATTARSNLGLGTSATLNVGTAASNVVQLDAGAKLPISTLPNSVLTTATSFSGDISGTNSNISVTRIRGITVSSTAPNAGEVLQYNGTQYVPTVPPSALVSSVAGRTGAVVLSNTDISGLGGAAVLNVGTVAGTVAAGDDSRITGALQNSAYNTDVADAALCTTSQTAYWNTISDKWACQNINFPADLVTSVAGKTGAVSLVSSDISGLGNSAGLNVGAVAGTVAAGDDSRIVNAVQTSTAHSGDVTGVYNNLSVNRIRGVAVSATAPNTGDILVYDGSQWVPAVGFPRYVKMTSNQAINSTALVDVTELSFSVTAGKTYRYKFNVMYTSGSTTRGFRIGITYPATTSASAQASIPNAIDGTGAYYHGYVNSSGDSVMSTNSPETAPNQLLATLQGVMVPSASGTVQLRAAGENAGTTMNIQAGSYVEVIEVP